MKHEMIASRTTGEHAVVTISLEGVVTKDMHNELAMFAPALVAVVGRMHAKAWYDDEDHSITIRRDLDAPPMPHR